MQEENAQDDTVIERACPSCPCCQKLEKTEIVESDKNEEYGNFEDDAEDTCYDEEPTDSEEPSTEPLDPLYRRAPPASSSNKKIFIRLRSQKFCSSVEDWIDEIDFELQEFDEDESELEEDEIENENENENENESENGPEEEDHRPAESTGWEDHNAW